MDCFCLRKKTSYDFSSPYAMSSSGTYRTSVIVEDQNGEVPHMEKANGKHHEIIEKNHTNDDVILKEQNTKNDLQNGIDNDLDLGYDLENNLEKDNDSHKDDASEKDQSSDVNRNHESHESSKIVTEEVVKVSEVNEVNAAMSDEGHDTSRISVSSDKVPEIIVVDEERHSVHEDTNNIIDEGEGNSDIIQGQGNFEGQHDLHQSPNDNDIVSLEEEQNVHNSSHIEDQSLESKPEPDIDRKPEHTPSYDVTAAAGDVPKDVVHMY